MAPPDEGGAQDQTREQEVDKPAFIASAPPPQDFAPEPTDDELLTDWERRFLASIACQEFDLTAAQQAKRDEIHDLIEQRREAWRRSPPPRDGHAAWQPVGSVLERLFQSLDFTPSADFDDPHWRPWHVRAGDLVEVHGACEAIGRWFSIAASPLVFKIEDKRCFAQAGWPLVTGKKSPIRARKAKQS